MCDKNEGKNIILIVDDMPDNLDVLVSYLEYHQYEIIVANSGEEAIQRIESHMPDIILMDIIMPGMNGVDTCRLIKTNIQTKDIPIIFMTALSDMVDKIKGFEAGGVDYITKPFHLDELLARVKTHLTIKNMQQELIILNQDLHHTNATKDKFFSLIAHDLRNPFNKLIISTDLLVQFIDDLEPQKIKEFVMDIHKASKGAFDLLENLLEWSKIQTNAIDFIPNKFDLYKNIDNVIVLYANAAQLKGIEIINLVKNESWVYAHEETIESVVKNVISNSVKYCDEGDTITISAQESEDYLMVTIVDTGGGIDEEIMQNLYRIDIKCSTPGTKDEHGTGLGLILCKEFIERNGGQFNINSELWDGTTVNFLVPIYHSQPT